MDLLPEESPKIAKKHRFRSLKLVNVNMEDVLGEIPFGFDYGKLDNGLSYYVRSNSKPRMRAALALVVKAGSVLEKDDERGVAHIVEHLAFSATKKYTNHDIVKFLESIGAEFGACQNAVTSCDETVYELFVPVDKPELLSQAISVLAEFSTEVRVSADDLEKERGAVMEEYRANRNASGRPCFSSSVLPPLPLSLSISSKRWQNQKMGLQFGKRLNSRVCCAGRDESDGGRVIDENMIVLRKRIHEMKMVERNYEPPMEWMEWEKQYYASYDEIICTAMGLLQSGLMNTRPCLALGILAFVMMSISASMVMIVLNLMEGANGIMAAVHLS